MDYKEVYEQWLSNPYFDEATKGRIKEISQKMTMRSKNVFIWIWSLVPQVFVESSEQEPTA